MHNVQFEFPDVLEVKDPAGHGEHAMLPLFEENEPALHLEHVELPFAGEKKPG